MDDSELQIIAHYGSTGCVVFKRGYKIRKILKSLKKSIIFIPPFTELMNNEVLVVFQCKKLYVYIMANVKLRLV